MAYLSSLLLLVYGFTLMFCVRGWPYHYSPYNMKYVEAYNGSRKCSHVNGNFTYQSNCHFTCSDGYVWHGFEHVSCTKEGDWLAPFLHCTGSVPKFCGRDWPYHNTLHNMEYDNTFKYCTEQYTSMVAIQNQEENKHLSNILPFNKTYYWIGIRKNQRTDNWIWTNWTTIQAGNWATNEPNDLRDNKDEDYVEKYIKQAYNIGKWNEEPCYNEKAALCYTASCHPSCNNHGECVETINNYTCNCYDGFYGDECEHEIQCKRPEVPLNGVIRCSNDGELLPDKTICNFSCNDGFSLVGSSSVLCMTPGQWTEEPPKCNAIQCERSKEPENGVMDCSDHEEMLPYKSRCSFSCNEGFALVGSSSTTCMFSHQWTEKPPKCEEIQCKRPEVPLNGVIRCSNDGELLPDKTICNFSCNDGFSLVGSSSVLCMTPGQWTEEPPKCNVVKSLNISYVIAPLVIAIVSVLLIWLIKQKCKKAKTSTHPYRYQQLNGQQSCHIQYD